MGNSALLVVFASILSGVMIFLNIQRINTESNMVQSQLQEEVLARELAHNGLSLALARIFGEKPYYADEIDFGGGTIRISERDVTANQISFKVLGEYGDAQYMISTEYDYEIGFPCQICVDGPFSMELDEETRINGGSEYEGSNGDFQPINISTSELDRLQNQPGLENLYPIDQMVENLNSQLDNAFEGLTGDVEEVNLLQDQTLDDILPDVDPSQNIPWMLEFYFTTLDKMDLSIGSQDALFPASVDPQGFAAEFGSINPEAEDYRRSYLFGETSANSIVRVDGDMVIRNGSSVTGTGILIVEGDLLVDPGAILNWNGIVFLRPETSNSVSKFDGTVTINGSLLAYQEAIPPGSHMDVTTNRDLSGRWDLDEGRDVNQPGIPIAGPWLVHQHKWDQSWFSRPPISASREVFFRRNGSATEHEGSVRFHESLNSITSSGVEKVFLEFVNPGQSGMGVFSLEINDEGTLKTYQNSIAGGFGGKTRSINFRPADLREFGVMIRSVRFLQLLRDPDPNNSGLDGAVRVARDIARKGSFYIAVRDANPDTGNRLLMTTSIYQHIREDESEDFEQELEDLRNDILDGNFGLTIEMGPGTTLNYDEVAASDALKRTEFPAYTHNRTWTQRCNSSDVNCDLARLF